MIKYTMSLHFIKYLQETKDQREIRQNKLSFERDELDPVIEDFWCEPNEFLIFEMKR